MKVRTPHISATDRNAEPLAVAVIEATRRGALLDVRCPSCGQRHLLPPTRGGARFSCPADQASQAVAFLAVQRSPRLLRRRSLQALRAA